jgi:DNA-binding NtrC family response regulator
MVGTILLYQDDGAIRAFLAEALGDEGHRVLVCATVQDVERAAAADPTALAVVDTWGANSSRLDHNKREEIRTFTDHIPTVMLTTHAWATATPADELGLLALLPMPLELEQLVETVGQQVTNLINGARQHGNGTVRSTSRC